MFKASNDVENDLISITKKGQYNLVLLMLGKSIYEGSLLGRLLGFTTNIINPEKLFKSMTGRSNIFNPSPFDDFTLSIIDKTAATVGIIIDKDFESADRVFIPVFDLCDFYLLKYATGLIKNNDSQVILLDGTQQLRSNSEIHKLIRKIEETAPKHFSLSSADTIEKDFLETQDLMLISSRSWKYLIDSKSLWLSDAPSTLIISSPK